jgi:hypothetical protein
MECLPNKEFIAGVRFGFKQRRMVTVFYGSLPIHPLYREGVA